MTQHAPKGGHGRFFEDFAVGQHIRHPIPRTIHGGDLSLYMAATGDRRPLHSSTEFAKSLGFHREVVHDLLVFHIVFGKTVEGVSLNAVANLGYADVRFSRAVYPGDTLRAETEVVGLRETSSGKAGVVYVKSRGLNQKDQEVLSFYRWVLVNRRGAGPAVPADVPELPDMVPATELPVPAELNLERFEDLAWVCGEDAPRWEDYQVGERIHHAGGMTVDESDHTFVTRLYHNTARVHFNQHEMASSRFGKRLVYGGHVISVAHALSFGGLENALRMAAWNGGTHANPTFAGDTLYAYTDVLATEEIPGSPRLGALRMRLVAVKNADPSREEVPLKGDDGRYDPRVVLDLDHWALVPRRA